MSPLIVIELPGEPATSARPRFGKGRTYRDPRHEATLDETVTRMRLAWRRPSCTGPVHLQIDALFRPPKRNVPTHCVKRPDWDNVGKFYCDALVRAGVLFDDASVIDGRVRKMYASAPGMERVIVTVWAADGSAR